tara:strand:- start:1018 stop:1620 length:603 start_codon:yes stop_codon:yes gene_type:complete
MQCQFKNSFALALTILLSICSSSFGATGTLTYLEQFHEGEYEGEYQCADEELGIDCKPHGRGTMEYWNGDRYAGGFFEGEKSGQGTLYIDIPYHFRNWYGRECYFTGIWKGNQLTDGVMSIEGVYYYAGQVSFSFPEGEGKLVIDDTTWIGTFESGGLVEGTKTVTGGTTWDGTFRSGKLVEGVKTLSDGSTQKINRPYF